jgi:hypothetical protein
MPTAMTGPEDELVLGRDEALLVHEWRAEQLRRLGLARWRAELFAGVVDWHAVADLVGRGCAPTLALTFLC